MPAAQTMGTQILLNGSDRAATGIGVNQVQWRFFHIPSYSVLSLFQELSPQLITKRFLITISSFHLPAPEALFAYISTLLLQGWVDRHYYL